MTLSLIRGSQEEFDPGMDHENESGAAARSRISNDASESVHGQHPERPDGDVQILERSRTSQVFEDMLTTCYTPMEVWYARSVIDKVHST